MGFSFRKLLEGAAADLNVFDGGKSHGNMQGRPRPASTARPTVYAPQDGGLQVGQVDQPQLQAPKPLYEQALNVQPVQQPQLTVAPPQPAVKPLQVTVAQPQNLQVGNETIAPSPTIRTQTQNRTNFLDQQLNPSFGTQLKQSFLDTSQPVRDLPGVYTKAFGNVAKGIVTSGIDTAKLPYDATRLMAAEATHNDEAITNANNALHQDAQKSWIMPLASLAEMGAVDLAGNQILDNPNTSPELKQAQLGGVNEALAPIGYNLNDSALRTNLKNASLFTQAVATPVLSKGGSTAIKSVTNAGKEAVAKGVTSKLVTGQLKPVSQSLAETKQAFAPLANVTTNLIDKTKLAAQQAVPQPKPLNEVGGVGKDVRPVDNQITGLDQLKQSGRATVSNGNSSAKITAKSVNFGSTPADVLHVEALASTKPKTGSATKLLNSLKEHADATGAHILLEDNATPKSAYKGLPNTPQAPMSQKQLTSWYEKHGFKRVKLWDGSPSDSMIYKANSAQPKPKIGLKKLNQQGGIRLPIIGPKLQQVKALGYTKTSGDRNSVIKKLNEQGGINNQPHPKVSHANPIDPSLSQEDKAKELLKLTMVNKPKIDEVLKSIDKQLGTSSKSSIKAPENIISKANRPSIKAVAPTHDVEHIRDSLRSKTVINSFDDVPKVIEAIKKSGGEIIKTNTGKMLNPSSFGFSHASVDIKMPNGQLVEHYMPLKEVEAAKKAGNHAIFEKWRGKTPEEIANNKSEYKADKYKSENSYLSAHEQAMARNHLSPSEAKASWANIEASLAGKGRKSSLSSSTVKGKTSFHSPSGERNADKSSPNTQTRPSSALSAKNGGVRKSLIKSIVYQNEGKVHSENKFGLKKPTVARFADGREIRKGYYEDKGIEKGGEPYPVNKDGTITVYHHSQDPNSFKNGIEHDEAGFGKNMFFTSNDKGINSGKNSNQGKVLSFNIDPKKLTDAELSSLETANGEVWFKGSTSDLKGIKPNKSKFGLKPLGDQGFARIPGKAPVKEAPIVGPNLSRSSKASQKSTKTQEPTLKPSSPKSQVSQDKSFSPIISPTGKTKSSINTKNLNLTKKQKANISKESQQVVDSLSNAEVERIAKTANLNKATYSTEQTKKIIAQQLTVRQDAVRLQNEAEAARKAGDFKLAEDKLRQSADMANISTDQGRNIARQLQARRIMANELNTPQQRVFKVLDVNGVNPDVYIPRLAKVDFNNPDEIIKAYRELVPATPEQWLDKVRYTNMLSSPLTHIVNMTSNLQGVLGVGPVQKLFEGGVDTVHHLATGAPRTRFAAEAGHYYKGAAKSFPEAAARFKDVMSGKVLNKNPDYQMFMNAPLAKGGWKGTADKIYSFIPKLLEASDQFATTLVKGGEMSGLKHRVNKGVSMTADTMDVVAEEAATSRVFRQQLGKEGQGHLLDMIDFIPKTVSKGRTSKNPYLRNFTKFTFPFVATPTNLFKQGIEYSPVGVLTLHGSADKTAQAAKMAMGTATIGMIAGALAAGGDITFGEPSNSKERDAFRAEGKQPYAFKLGNKWYGYSKLHPAIAFNFALVAAAKDMKDKRSLNESGLQQFLGTGANVLGFFRDQSYMKNVGDMTSIFQSKDGAGLDNLFANQATNSLNQLSPFKSMVSWIGRQVDPTQRKVDYSKSAPEQIYQGLVKDIPGLNKNVPARINPYNGEPIKNDNPILNSWSPVRVTNDKGYGNTTSLNTDQRQQIRDMPNDQKEVFRRGIVEDKAAKNKVAKEKDNIKKSDTGDSKKTSDGKYYTKVDGDYKTFDNKKEADIAIEKTRFAKSKDNYKVVGDTVLTKDSKGKVSDTPKITYDHSLNSATLTSQKNAGDVEGWNKTAAAQMENIKKQLSNPNVDPLDKVKLENEATALQKSINKYAGYGGFTKGKTAKKGKGSKGGKGKSGGFDYAKGLASINSASMRNQNALRSIVKKNRITVKKRK